jgi:ABC-type dipeptide/oligopeptide/nickel transport system permease subunit
LSNGATTEAVAPFQGPALPETAPGTHTAGQLFWRRFRQDKLALAAVVFLAALTLTAIAAPLVVSLLGAPGPNVLDRSALDSFGTATGPSASHWFGVDALGRDVLSRTIYGARVSLMVAFLATGISVLIGAILGMMAGFRRGWVDTVVSRSVDVLLAIPYLLLAIGLAASCSTREGCFGGALKPGLGVVIFVIAVTSWTFIARIVRGETLSLREKEFVEAARAAGASNSRIVFREILPNLAAPIIVYASILIPQVILYEAALSFLGVGVQPPTASWGQMIADATGEFDTAWWYMLFPGLALLFTVLAFNLVGDALQDALNPKHRRS